LDTDSLVALKQEGVSKAVIEAMLKRTSPAQPQASAGAAAGTPLAPAVPALERASRARESVRLRTRDGEVALKAKTGEHSGTYAFIAVLMFLDFPGAMAKIRTTDKRPSAVVLLDDDPKSAYVFFVKLDSEKKKDKRSLKIGKEKLFSATATLSPDPDWTVPCDVKEESPGVWTLTPKEELEPGEYGVYFARGLVGVASPSSLFDFGVDK
jgi:hypothetical protein